MPEPVYTFDRQSMRRISAAVQKVEGVKDRKGNKWYPLRGAGGSTLQIGKTTAAWPKGTEATVEVYSKKDRTPETKPDGSRKTEKVFNLFADIQADKWVAWINGYLVAAQCDDEEDPAGGG